MQTTSTIRVLPAPESNPPYDDEVGRPAPRTRGTAPDEPHAVQGSLTLPFALPSGVPARPEPPAAALWTLQQSGERPKGGTTGPTAATRRWAGRFVQALIEILAGVRPVTQLKSWTDPAVYEQVRRRATVPGGWPPGRGRGARPVVHSLRVSQPGEHAIEICAVVRAGGHARAMALRLEGTSDHPLCNALELG